MSCCHGIQCPTRLDQDGEDPALADQESAESSHPEIVTMPSRFEKSQEKGFIDVWWLYDDGGTILTPPYYPLLY